MCYVLWAMSVVLLEDTVIKYIKWWLNTI
jgi:hypothetical protein